MGLIVDIMDHQISMYCHTKFTLGIWYLDVGWLKYNHFEIQVECINEVSSTGPIFTGIELLLCQFRYTGNNLKVVANLGSSKRRI